MMKVTTRESKPIIRIVNPGTGGMPSTMTYILTIFTEKCITIWLIKLFDFRNINPQRNPIAPDVRVYSSAHPKA
jgi:hypothetical protein